MKNNLDLVRGEVWKKNKNSTSRFFMRMLQLENVRKHLHAVVYHSDTLASSFSKSQIYIYSNVFSAVKVDTA